MFSFNSKKKPTLQDYHRQVEALVQYTREDEQVKGAGGLLFRVAYNTHLNLSDMADRKAHLMIVVNIFLLTFLITKRNPGVLLSNQSLLIPNVLLAAMSLTTIVLAILVARPRLPARVPDRPLDAVNWLFFGSFCHYSLDTFHKNIWLLIHDDRKLYAAMTRDFYWMGLALSRKFRLLRICYDIFFYGLLVIAAAYVMAALWG